MLLMVMEMKMSVGTKLIGLPESPHKLSFLINIKQEGNNNKSPYIIV